MNFDMELKGKCILSAEDNEVNQIVLEHTLVEQEHPFVIVSNGAEAIEGWRQLDPKLILMDISMPVLNGYEAIEAIRAEEDPNNRVPILVLTAHALTGDRERALESGADDYITKPINPDDLLSKVKMLLGETSSPVFAAEGSNNF